MLKNLLDRSRFGAAAFGPPCPPHLRPVVPAQEFESCDQHGKYLFRERGPRGWLVHNPGGCPVCLRQANSDDLLAGSNLSPRFAHCTFDSFVADTPDKAKVLAKCRTYAGNFRAFREAGASLILCGPVGTGKNHLATSIARDLLGARFTVLRVKAAQFLDAYWAKDFNDRTGWLAGMAAVDLLMIDEIGRASAGQAAQDAFFRLIDGRYEAVRPTLITTNLNRDELISVLGDATYDRLTQAGGIRLTLNWESARPTAPAHPVEIEGARA
jgi:DNA replication protein DnaC